MKTDIDELHKLVELRNIIGIHNLPRSCYKTCLLCHELVGAISVSGGPDIVVVSFSKHCNLPYFLSMLFEIFNEYEIEYKYAKQLNKIMSKQEEKYLKTILFVLEDPDGCNLWGLGDYYYLYLE